MRVIDVDSQVYPPLLLEVTNHPDRLYVRGESKVLLEKMVAVVGSRKMSIKGEEVTRRVVKQLVDMGMVVVWDITSPTIKPTNIFDSTAKPRATNLGRCLRAEDSTNPKKIPVPGCE